MTLTATAALAAGTLAVAGMGSVKAPGRGRHALSPRAAPAVSEGAALANGRGSGQ